MSCDNDFLEIYYSIKKSLKEGGQLYIHTPNGDYFLEILKKLGVIKQITGHVGVRNFRQYKDLLTSIGFTELKVEYIPHYNILGLFHFLSYIPIFGKFFRARLLIVCID